MQHPTKLIAILAAAALTFGCAAQATSEEKSSTDPIAQAEAALKKASAAGYQWRDSAATLDKAKAAAAAGDAATAEKLAKRAKFEAEQAVSQAERQAKDWQSRVPR